MGIFKNILQEVKKAGAHNKGFREGYNGEQPSYLMSQAVDPEVRRVYNESYTQGQQARRNDALEKNND